MKINPETLARASSRHAWRTVGIWAVILVLGFGASGVLLSNALTTDFDFTNNPEAIQAQTLLQQKQLEQDVTPETFVMTGSEGATTDPAFVAQVNAALKDIRGLDSTGAIAHDPSTNQPEMPAGYPVPSSLASNPQVAALGPFPSQDGTAVLFNVILVKDSDKTATIVDPLDAIQAKYSTGDTHFYMLGEPTSTADFKKISEDDLKKGETIGVIVAIVVLLIVFGSLIAGVTPIIMGIFAIGVAFGIVGLLGAVWRWSFFVPNLITMLGLAVGIDYSLFIVSRYREERRRGRDNLEAIGMSGATANRAVFFSGLTVVIALAGMLLVPTTIFRGLAGGAIIVVLISVALSMTLLPALMALFSDRLVKPGFVFGRGRTLEQGRAGGFWDRESRSVMKRPWVYLIVTATFLILLSVPYWTQSRADGVGHGMKKGFSGIEAIPDGIPTKDAFNVLVAKFPKESGAVSTAQVVIPGAKTDPTISQQIQSLDAQVANDPAFAHAQPAQTSQDGTVTLVAIPFAGEATDSQSQAAVDAVTRLRDTYVPQVFGQDSGVLVGGDTAMTKDFFDISDRYTPIIILLVLGLSFILLTVVFRSVVVPAKAIVMNLLSVGAAYGLITLIFQQGGPSWAKSIADALNFTQVQAIESWLPLFLFSILFGLSMDYQVFLLSRIREEYDKTSDNSEAVAYGLRTTGGIITGAAVIMVAVFAAFASGRIAALQEMGFGLAVAVFLDATIVRSVLVPSAMKLLGDRNWYLPKWLQWLPKVDVEGHAAAEHRVVVPDTPAELVEAHDPRD